MRSDQFISSRLLGRLWHVTSRERFDFIRLDGCIRPEPNIPNQDRWSTSKGPRWYPFVRFLGGFSLFDFPDGFDIDGYRSRCPSSSLEAFIPFPREWGHAIWLEIDQDKQRRSLMSGSDVWAKCEREGRGRRCMPFIEAAHIGEMPTSSILAAYEMAEGWPDWRPMD